MKILRIIFPAVLLSMLLTCSAFAQSKVATVDMDKVLKNYWKTQQAQAAIEAQANQLEKDDKSMKDDFTKAQNDYKQLLEQANDQAISADEREKRKQAADTKLKQLQDNQAAIDQYERQAQSTLAEKKQQVEQNLFKEIQQTVAAKAKSAGDTLVVNTSVQTIVIYAGTDNDLTDDVLKQLNAGAPIDVTKPASTTSAPPLLNSLGTP
jgi:outer membrane protein